ncbi:MAG: Gfo/Idh/MocA family oxidoreductase [Candidatus Sumerlaeota bacterium]|nr:Gfo/Idh/MocA family oxidoreductase [Candidatus Sumerlaeota bacterium]
MMQKVRFGVIGCGGMGSNHVGYLPTIKGAELTAVCDIDPEALGRAEQKSGAKGFLAYQDLIKSGLADAVIVATPHYFHPEIMIYAFSKGVHVMSEKPVGVHVKQAEMMNRTAAKHPKLVFGVMFQARGNAGYRKAKELIDSGEMGKMLRATCIETAWYRSQAYYDSGGWRATWNGEGGGVLLNQCPHTLDIFTWLCGVPRRVMAMVKLGARHQIEVDDEVCAILEYDDGVFGQFVTSSGEAPGTSIMEIAFDQGLLRVGRDSVQFLRNRVPVFQHLKTSKERFAKPEAWNISLPMPKGGGGEKHAVITQNFVNAILKGEKLIAPGVEGIKGLSLGNAILLSGVKGKPVDLPLNGNVMEAFIKEQCRKSTFKKPKIAKKVADDMASSFH